MHLTNHEYYNCEVITSDSTKYRISANWLHSHELDNWKDWQCEAGYNRVYIDSDNNVFSGQCFNDNLGNLDTQWTLLNTPTVCKRDRCTGCTDDLIVYKKEVDK